MSATASGSDARPNGDTKSREHNQGNQGRKFTDEQKAAVIRVRKCSHTAFYQILGIEKGCLDAEIKKAYRKLSLLTHPDKNGYEGADEAFKMVSRAFQILSDPEKKTKYDTFGGDPDSRFGSSAPSSSPFSGFTQTPRSARSSMFEEEISPEELFNRFFGGGGMGGGFGPFAGAEPFMDGQQFVFNLGGGPGFRVHQFGGPRPRRRPRDPNNPQADRPSSISSLLLNLLPLLVLFVLPMLSSLLASSPTPGPEIYSTPDPPHTMRRVSRPRGLQTYYVDPNEVPDFKQKNWHEFDKQVEIKYIHQLQYECTREQQVQNRMIQDAQGFFFQDADKMAQARRMEKKSCNKLRSHGIPHEYY